MQIQNETVLSCLGMMSPYYQSIPTTQPGADIVDIEARGGFLVFSAQNSTESIYTDTSLYAPHQCDVATVQYSALLSILKTLSPTETLDITFDVDKVFIDTVGKKRKRPLTFQKTHNPVAKSNNFNLVADFSSCTISGDAFKSILKCCSKFHKEGRNAITNSIQMTVSKTNGILTYVIDNTCNAVMKVENLASHVKAVNVFDANGNDKGVSDATFVIDIERAKRYLSIIPKGTDIEIKATQNYTTFGIYNHTNATILAEFKIPNVAGTFPDCGIILKKPVSHIVSTESATMLMALERVNIMYNLDSLTKRDIDVMFTNTDASVSYTSATNDIIESVPLINGNAAYEDFSARFNLIKLIESFSICQSKDVQLAFSSPHPGLFIIDRVAGPTQNEFSGVTMLIPVLRSKP